MEAAQYESLGRADDALLVKMLQAGLVKLKAAHSVLSHLCELCWPGNTHGDVINLRVVELHI